MLIQGKSQKLQNLPEENFNVCKEIPGTAGRCLESEKTRKQQPIGNQDSPSSNLLHELTASPEHHPSKMLRAPSRKQRFNRRTLLPHKARSANTIHDNRLLSQRLLRIHLVAPQRRNHLRAFFPAFLREEPARRFGKEEHAAADDGREDDLESDWEAPGQVCGTVRGAVVDPVRGERAEGDDAAFDAD